MSAVRPGALVGALILPAVLLAQQPYDAKAAQGMTATWAIDLERSDPLPPAPRVMDPNARTVLVPADQVRGSASGGGRRGGGVAGSPPAVGTPPPPVAQRGGGGRNPYVGELLQQLRAPEQMTFSASDTAVHIRVQDVDVAWIPDGRKHQQAQMDGTLLFNLARWKGSKVELIDGVEGSAELKREVHLIDDGQALEVKLELSGPGVPKKVSRKVVYVRQ